MTQPDPNRRFQIAFERARADWAVADPALSAGLSGCVLSPQGIVLPFFRAWYLVTHPAGDVLFLGPDMPVAISAALAAAKPAHPSVAIALIHHLLTADGTPAADCWVTFRELPDGLFYAQAFAGH